MRSLFGTRTKDDIRQSRADRRRLRWGPTRYYRYCAPPAVDSARAIFAATPQTRARAKALRTNLLRKHERRAKLILRLLQLQDGACYLCGGEFGETITPTLDHVKPLGGGGRNFRNILLAHAACNNHKGDRMPTAAESAYLRRVNVALANDEDVLAEA